LTGPEPGRVAELFAGVGGFRLGLEGKPYSVKAKNPPWTVVWSNQWEPGARVQHASDCYTKRFKRNLGEHYCEDIAVVLDRMEAGDIPTPDVELVVGGFPCQDYSVARVLSQAAGLEGKKGVLWWQIQRFLKLTRPRFLFLENVDRLLKSPADQRGRDFAIMLHCLSTLGYYIEWRVVNAADYGFPQRRRRTLIVGELVEADGPPFGDPADWLCREGVLASALPVEIAGSGERPLLIPGAAMRTFTLPPDLLEVSEAFSESFQNAGVMFNRKVWTVRVAPTYNKRRKRWVLGDCLQDDKSVPREYLIPPAQLPRWRYLKGQKHEERTVERNGFTYVYSEGAVQFPDRREEPSRTILTGEGGSSPSRFKHVIKTKTGRRWRRLTPIELEKLNGFPANWTRTGMPDTKRAFCMGNALVVGIIDRVGSELAQRRARRRTQVIRKAG
jgi:DNA (cytosine-5)-methyltransferase 1